MVALVQSVDAARQRLSLSLKPSLTMQPGGAFASSLFADLELAERLRCGQP